MKITRYNLYDAAFRYKKAGLWKKLWDNDVFAVRLSSGETGFISILGKNGEYNALNLYIGEEGFRSYRKMADYATDFNRSPFRDHEMLLQQVCLQMALEEKDYIMPEELDEVRAYAKKNDIRLSGKNAYPSFIKYERFCHPWKVKTGEDMTALYEALETAVLVAEELKHNKPIDIGIRRIQPFTKGVPLFGVKDGKLQAKGYALLPQDAEEEYAPVIAESELDVAKLKKLPKRGTWETELITMMSYVQEDPEETPYYPLLLLVVESREGYMLPVPMIERADKNPQGLLTVFAEGWKKYGSGPKEMRCRDERTFALLKDICEKSGIRIKLYEGAMHALEDAEDALLEKTGGMGEDEVIEMVGSLLEISDEELRAMPQPLVDQLWYMIENDMLPEDIAEELGERLRRL